jgi:hypothetical protein
MARVEIKLPEKFYTLCKDLATHRSQAPLDIIIESVLAQYLSPGEAQTFLASLQSNTTIPTTYEVSKNSLRAKPFKCLFCDSDEEFEVPILKKGSQMCDTNEFEILQYKQASSSQHDFCDYSLLEVFTCPHCGFSSKFEGHFLSKNFKGEWESKIDPSANVKKAMNEAREERMEALSNISDEFCSENRGIEDALSAAQVAIMSAETFREATIDVKRPGWGYIIACYHLQIADFLKRLKRKEGYLEALSAAVQNLNKAHSAGLSGEAMYKTAYILTVFAIKRKDVQTARTMWGFLNKALEGALGPEKALINKYLPRVKNMYQDFALALRKKKG